MAFIVIVLYLLTGMYFYYVWKLSVQSLGVYELEIAGMLNEMGIHPSDDKFEKYFLFAETLIGIIVVLMWSLLIVWGRI